MPSVAQFAFLFSLFQQSYESGIMQWSNSALAGKDISSFISGVDVLRKTQSRSFLHCCSLCHVSDGCRGVAYAQGECWLINGTAAGWRLLEEECSTCDFRLVFLDRKQAHIGLDCAALLAEGASEDGVYSIHPPGAPAPFQTFCSMSSGGWSVIQRRVDDSVDFYRGWADYVAGFGDFSGNMWAGLDNIHAMTSCRSAELWVTMGTFEGGSAEARYSVFHVGDAASGYVLNVAGYSGTAGDSMTQHNLHKFTTYDNDQDSHNGNCAVMYTGAWWYTACHASNPNGRYLHGDNSQYAAGVIWYHYKGHYYSLKSIEFKVRCK